MQQDPLNIMPTEETDFHLSDILQRIRARWKLILLVTVLSLGAGASHFWMTPEAFQAKATIQIERRSLSPLINSQFQWMESWWNIEFYPTQYELLESRGLSERVVQELGLAEDSFFNPGGAALAPPDPTADTEKLVQQVRGRLAQRLLGGLQVVPRRNTQIVDIFYRSADPEFASRAANGFAQSFIDWGVDIRSDTAGKASSFLSSQVQTTKAQIEERENRLRVLGKESNIVDVDAELKQIANRLAELNTSYVAAQGDRITAEATLRSLGSQSRDRVSVDRNGGLVDDLRRELIVLEQEYEAGLQVYKEDWPKMVELRSKIEEARRRLSQAVDQNARQSVEAARSVFQQAVQREQGLAKEIESIRGTLSEQKSAAVELTNLQLEINNSRQLLDNLLSSQSETEVSARLQGTRDSNVRIIEHALTPGGPYLPSLSRDLYVALLAGLLAGIGLVLLLDYFDRTVKGADEIERRLGMPNLAVIPDLATSGRSYRYRAVGETIKRRRTGTAATRKESIELLPHDHPRLAASEAYRSLRTALLLSSAKELRVVSVTSANSGEGKTATIANLGVVMAQLGRQVLIVDADLRKPRQHQVFGQSGRVGLVDYLTGGASLDQIICETRVPNLWLVPSGPTPPNPSELLSSERMRDFLSQVRERFGFTLVDTPPVLAVTDSTLVGSMTDGIVFCVRSGSSLREDVRAARDRLRMADVKILGAVLNRLREGHVGYDRSYRYYRGYGEEANSDSAA